jgi:hypothetical protein
MKIRDRIRESSRRDNQRDANGAHPTRQARRPYETQRLPVDPKTGQPIPPRAQPGYDPGFSTLAQQAYWDKATRDVVLNRVYNVPPLRFFTPVEVPLAQAVVDRVLPQDDRDDEHKVPILNYIDERLAQGRTGGYRFEVMPPDGEAMRLGLRGIELIAQHLYGQPFVDLRPDQQDAVLLTLHDGEPPAGQEIWDRMSVKHFWLLLAQDCAGAYYAHPYAWDEIGFGGPAYPRGYMRLENGQREPWEVDEQRYEWSPPPFSLSGGYTNLDKESPKEQQLQTPGQGGTH